MKTIISQQAREIAAQAYEDDGSFGNEYSKRLRDPKGEIDPLYWPLIAVQRALDSRPAVVNSAAGETAILERTTRACTDPAMRPTGTQIVDACLSSHGDLRTALIRDIDAALAGPPAVDPVVLTCREIVADAYDRQGDFAGKAYARCIRSGRSDEDTEIRAAIAVYRAGRASCEAEQPHDLSGVRQGRATGIHTDVPA